ncbi:hypothetical protein F4820DRAFT_193909 [Hypoxylon rubiginosum]|uniref:Uncharacterized protein n=1 Tax=Hypoxylon rubiginosum TaxID=110542 RepID=A0ACB9YIG4_9PEZI|nr:hypothetical protein F4820DRAFT_193909 [Hypoxylon rubiginosum]
MSGKNPSSTSRSTQQESVPAKGSTAWPLIACIGALGLIPQLGSQALPYLPSDGLAGLLADALNYALNVTLAFGTPYLAWHIGAVRGPVPIAGQLVSAFVLRAIVLYNILAAAGTVYLQSGLLKSTLLWGVLANWWFLGVVLLPRSYLENGWWWLRIALAFKLNDVLLSGI